MLRFVFESEPYIKSQICERVLSTLPDWFGLPDANRVYCRDVQQKPFLCINSSENTIGFASLQHNSPYVLEIFVMGIEPAYHRKGIGVALIDQIKAYARQQSYHYLEVKTLDSSRICPAYDKTRAFYEKVGFIPVDVLRHEWGDDNPCLLMLMPLS